MERDLTHINQVNPALPIKENHMPPILIGYFGQNQEPSSLPFCQLVLQLLKPRNLAVLIKHPKSFIATVPSKPKKLSPAYNAMFVLILNFWSIRLW